MLPHVWKSYSLGENYNNVISNLKRDDSLKEYLSNKEYYLECDETQTIIFKTEILRPLISKEKPRVLLLLSNPNARSIMDGMILAPENRINQFWFSMEGAKMFSLPSKIGTIKQIEKEKFSDTIRPIFQNLRYDSDFEFYFYTFFSFPSRDPEDLIKLFGESFFNHMVNESRCNLLEFIQIEEINNIVCFGRQAFQYISKYDERYLKKGYQSEVKKNGFMDSALLIFNIRMPETNLYLTYPTMQGGAKAPERIKSLEVIKAEIIKRCSLRS